GQQRQQPRLRHAVHQQDQRPEPERPQRPAGQQQLPAEHGRHDPQPQLREHHRAGRPPHRLLQRRGRHAGVRPAGAGGDHRGIGPGIVVASDNTLGAYSPFQGRLYVAYVIPGPNFASPEAPTGLYTDNTNIALTASDDGGATWFLLSRQVNDDKQGQGFLVG